VIALLADVNSEGHVARLVSQMQGSYWRDFWDHLQIRPSRFQDVGLSANDTDAVVWRLCQQQRLYLLTNSPNDDDADSLEATIRAFNTLTSLPVFTISDAGRILQSKDYAARVVESLFDHLLRIETLHGTGRLFLP
jgi:hypothetical protein